MLGPFTIWKIEAQEVFLYVLLVLNVCLSLHFQRI